MGEIFGLVYIAILVGVILAIFRLFSIDKSLKGILEELQAQRGATPGSNDQH
ncbi:MAG TPA: hypothetical protein VFE61_10405 [Candidatus Sulfotelmatobacter sp.]|jgi:hypothetical protein|nr:hypothetical protein [Candidatus Sulfotelmatobacter sp.]